MGNGFFHFIREINSPGFVTLSLDLGSSFLNIEIILCFDSPPIKYSWKMPKSLTILTTSGVPAKNNCLGLYFDFSYLFSKFLRIGITVEGVSL